MKQTLFTITLTILLSLPLPLFAHDTWVEANTPLVRAGDVVYLSLKMGNHGNNHRDFKLAAKVDPAYATLQVIWPGGQADDLKPRLTDQGMDTRTGYWSAPLQTAGEGMYLIASTYDRVVSYAPKRSIKSAKTFVVASASLDQPTKVTPGFDQPLGHALELVPLTNPVTMMSPGQVLKMKLLYKDQPLAGAKVSFIPRGVTLKEGFDEAYERTTDDQGVVSFSPRDANVYLIVAHHEDKTARGQGYESISYSATMTLMVPSVCACCGE